MCGNDLLEIIKCNSRSRQRKFHFICRNPIYPKFYKTLKILGS